nr:exopolysaccharide biosynthesis protein [Acuticoccus kalidii]
MFRQVAEAGQGDTISVEDALDAVGQSSFAALLLLPSAIIVTPISGIPGAPTIAAIVIVLVCIQFLAGRQRIWLPRRVLRVCISRDRFTRVVGRAEPMISRFDRLVRPRLTFLVNRGMVIAMALISTALALTMPPMEILPLTSTLTAAIIALFALAMLARDGLLALAGLVASLAAGIGFIGFVVPEVVGWLT